MLLLKAALDQLPEPAAADMAFDMVIGPGTINEQRARVVEIERSYGRRLATLHAYLKIKEAREAAATPS